MVYLSPVKRATNDNTIDNHLTNLHTVNTSLNDVNKNISTIISKIDETNSNTGINDKDKEEIKSQLIAALKSNHNSIKHNVLDFEKTVFDENNKGIDYENNEKYINYLLEIVDSEKDYVNDEYNRIRKELELKKRQIEINKYYELKYKRQIQIIKGIIFLCSIMIIITFIFKMNLFSERIFSIIIGTWFAVLVIYLAHSFYDIYVRDNIRFDEYDYSYISSAENKNVDETTLHLEDDIPSECITDDLGEKNESDGKMLI